MSDEENKKMADAFEWECFCQAYPHEAYESDPERFWEYFHSKCPDKSRTDMMYILRETA